MSTFLIKPFSFGSLSILLATSLGFPYIQFFLNWLFIRFNFFLNCIAISPSFSFARSYFLRLFFLSLGFKLVFFAAVSIYSRPFLFLYVFSPSRYCQFGLFSLHLTISMYFDIKYFSCFKHNFLLWTYHELKSSTTSSFTFFFAIFNSFIESNQK